MMAHSSTHKHPTSMGGETVYQLLVRATTDGQTILANIDKTLQGLTPRIHPAVRGLYRDGKPHIYDTTVAAFQAQLGQSGHSDLPVSDAEKLALGLAESILNHPTRTAHARKLSGLRANTNADVTVAAVLGLTDFAATVSSASSRGQQAQSKSGYQSRTSTVRSEDSDDKASLKSGTSDASARQDETTRRDALLVFRAHLTAIGLLDTVGLSPERLHGLLTAAQLMLERDGAVPPPPEDQETNPMETLRSTNDEREKAFRETGDLMAYAYTLRSSRNSLLVLPEYS